jgi:hypothetical protein
MFAALQETHGTIRAFAPWAASQHVSRARFPLPTAASHDHMGATQREIFIQGITKDGRTFRPSDWAERLAGAMSSFRPAGSGRIGAHIGYSPYCIPKVIDNVKCVVVNEALRDLEPMAWDFVMHFARDNELQVFEACLLPEPPTQRKG